MMWTWLNWLKVWAFVIIITIRGPLQWEVSWINIWQHRICQQRPRYLPRSHSLSWFSAQKIFLVLISVKRTSRHQGNSDAGRITSMKNSNDTTGNRTHDLPACTTDRKEKNDLMSARLTKVTHKLQLLWQKKKLAKPSVVVAIHKRQFLLTALQNHHQPFTVNTKFSHK